MVSVSGGNNNQQTTITTHEDEQDQQQVSQGAKSQFDAIDSAGSDNRAGDEKIQKHEFVTSSEADGVNRADARAAFDKADVDGSGDLDLTEFGAMDVDGDGEITPTDVEGGLIAGTYYGAETEQLFDTYSGTADAIAAGETPEEIASSEAGIMSLTELQSMIGTEFGGSSADVEALFNEADSDGNGGLTRSEFNTFMNFWIAYEQYNGSGGNDEGGTSSEDPVPDGSPVGQDTATEQ